jgi:hypothetical protein
VVLTPTEPPPRSHCAPVPGAPFAREVTSDEDLLGTCRYVAHNPVEAGLCPDPFAWPWASTAASAGLAAPAVLLDPGPLRAALGDGNDWQRRYREFIAT